MVLVRPSGEDLRLTCAAHRDAWATWIQGRYDMLTREEWVARGAGYRGPELGW